MHHKFFAIHLLCLGPDIKRHWALFKTDFELNFYPNRPWLYKKTGKYIDIIKLALPALL